MPRSSDQRSKPSAPLDRLDRFATLEALLRETLKTIVIVIYLGFAI